MTCPQGQKELAGAILECMMGMGEQPIKQPSTLDGAEMHDFL